MLRRILALTVVMAVAAIPAVASTPKGKPTETADTSDVSLVELKALLGRPAGLAPGCAPNGITTAAGAGALLESGLS